MSASMNKVFLIGFIGGDAEMKTTTKGTSYANFSLATTKRWKDKASGEWQSESTWHKCTAWGGIADTAERLVRKGAYVFVEGEINVSSWENAEGKKQYSTQIHVQRLKSLDRKSKSPEETTGADMTSGAPTFDETEEIPF